MMKFGKPQWCVLLALSLIAPLCVGSVEAQTSGTYFFGMGLQPREGANRALLSQEPAAVLVFTDGAGSADATALFNTWYENRERRFKGAVFGVVYHKPGDSDMILNEVIEHRDLKLPLFESEVDLLQGRDYRLMVIRGGKATDIPGLDFAALNRELESPGSVASAAVRSTAAVPTLSPTPTPPARPTATPNIVIEPSRATPAIAGATPVNMDDATSTVQPPAVAAAASLKTGKYLNQKFGMTAEFPQGFGYREAKSQDGAVAHGGASGQVDARVWSVPADQADAAGGRASIQAFLDRHFAAIEEQTGAHVNVQRRFRVDDNGLDGMEITYSFAKPIGVAGAAENSQKPVPCSGRIQVFIVRGVYKAVAAEGPSRDFELASPQVESFFQSFHPFLADEEGDPVDEESIRDASPRQRSRSMGDPRLDPRVPMPIPLAPF